MKTSRSFGRVISLMMAGGWLLSLSTGVAAPGAAGSATGFAGSTMGATTTSTGGGRAVAVAPVGGGHSAHVSAGSSARPASLSGNGFRPAVGAGFNAGISRSSTGPFTSPGVSTGPRANTPQATAARPPLQMPTVRNAWTDPANSRVSGGIPVASRQAGLTDASAHTGNHLYPGAYGYTPTRPANSRFQHGQHGNDGGRYHHRYYNNFPYAIYYPYLYSNSGDGYGGVGTYGYPGLASDYSGLSTDSSVANLGAPDFSNVPTNYYSYSEPAQGTPNAGNPDSQQAQPLPAAPAVGPQSPAPAEKSTGAPQGPDSLVEAVQSELSQRGYFAGKADAMYGPDTKEAIRRFQTDQRLPATGRINEATLHALRLD